MALRKLVAGNWKMNGRAADLAQVELIDAVARDHPAVDVALCVPATLIAAARAKLVTSAIGGQDCHWADYGAHTGCISVAMLAEAGATYVIVGHSERRADNHETSEEVRKKAEAAIAGGLTPIVCVGETLAEREAGEAVAVVSRQLRESLPAMLDKTVIAYEPVWAIGTGKTASAEDVADMHAAIRALVLDQVRILYGGSVKAANAAELLHVANVDGALVGGASLTAADFAPIVEAAALH